MDANEVGAQQTQTGSAPSDPGASTAKNERLTVVGIGASAGGLVAMQHFFDAIPDKSGLAFVVVAHMDPERENLLPGLLQKHTPMPVTQVSSQTRIEPDTVYVIPPGRRILVTDTHLDVETFEEPRGERMPIDYFFRSMAGAHRESVAVILSGGGTDGAVGVKSVKEQGGLLLVQDPDEAEHDSMPRAAIATGLADLVLPVAQLAEKLIANNEPKSKRQKVSHAHSDLENLMLATEIATVFLDTGLRIQRFTASAAELLNITPGDRGRPLSHLTNRLSYDGLPDDALRVLKELTPIEREVKDVSGRWFLAQLRPYHTLDDRIDSVVLTFVDITELKQTEEALRIEKELSEKIVATVRESLLVLKPDLRVEFANDSFYQMFSVEKEHTVGSLIYNLGNGQWDIPELRTLLEEILPQRNVFNDFRVEHNFESVGTRIMLLNARRLDHVERILLAIEDITEREQYEHELRLSEARYRTLFESIDAGFCIVEMLFDDDLTDYRFLETNPAFEALTGLTNVVGKRMRALRPHHEEHWFDAYGKVARTGEAQRFTQKAEQLGNRWYDVYAFRVNHPEDHRVAILFTDITQRKRAEESLRELNEQLEQRVEERTAQVRQLASQLTMAEHEERARISRILHDDLQQQLYGMQIQLTFLRSATESMPAAADMLHEIDSLEQVVQTSIQTARQLSVELSPPILQGEGLAEAISWLANLMYERYRLQIHIQGQGSFIVPDLDRRVLLFQSVRELLFNIVKHANVHAATVQLNEVEDPLLGTVYQISVSDDGVGFDSQEVLSADARPTGRGLLFIRERLRFIGGRLEIESVPGDGVIVTLIAPVEEILSAAEES